MKCEQCRRIAPINEFGGYLHYSSTKKSMEHLVQDGLFEKAVLNSFEIHYKCKSCHTLWALAEPDFPIRGYLLQK